MVPAIADKIKGMGLLLVADRSTDRHDTEDVHMSLTGTSTPEAVNGVLQADGILRFEETVEV